MNRRQKRLLEQHRIGSGIAHQAELSDMEQSRPNTWSANHPAYCYTELCPDKGLRQRTAAGSK